jgi:hypothetical protein
LNHNCLVPVRVEHPRHVTSGFRVHACLRVPACLVPAGAGR